MKKASNVKRMVMNKLKQEKLNNKEKKPRKIFYEQIF